MGERRGTVHRVPRLQVEGRPGRALQVFGVTAAAAGPGWGAPGAPGQVGPAVVLGDAGAPGNRKRGFAPTSHPLPNEFCISLDEDTWTGLKLASVGPPTFLVSTITP